MAARSSTHSASVSQFVVTNVTSNISLRATEQPNNLGVLNTAALQETKDPMNAHSADGSKLAGSIRWPKVVTGIGRKVYLGKVVFESGRSNPRFPTEYDSPELADSGTDELLIGRLFPILAERFRQRLAEL